MAAEVRRLTNVSEPQYQAIPPARVASRELWYVYVTAILLIGWGLVVLSAWISRQEFDLLFWRSMVPVGLELTIGVGLLFRRRWAWVLGIATSVIFIALGLREIVFIRGEYVVIAALVRYLVPAIVILVALLPGRARRAFLGE
jgi:hypothetical protein